MIDNNGFQRHQNPSQLVHLANANISGHRFLTVTFNDVLNRTEREITAEKYRKQFFGNIPLGKLTSKYASGNLNPVYESMWRRLYANPCTVLCFREEDSVLYIKEQTQEKKEASVFKKIMERQTGESFNIFHILKSIALPYYYILPHTNELKFLDFKTHNYFNLMSFCFESQLNIAMKI
ncbi:hypothetical protein TNIN_366541 [Trichonephila inaurata madagascariensis]|uniref:Uncharacterized protein n=1 Tax=Trichonephila inaurata madagascariensis TaxID=2747483 RepID=A0A8X6Y9K9_9ARAC|nr:hypothetical protein TNIN_366541 [Trichonephila inaurata madagascariensis]